MIKLKRLKKLTTGNISENKMIKELVEILQKVNDKITGTSDTAWTGYDTQNN